MRFPTLFVNHGGGPMPLLGQQPKIVEHLQQVRKDFLLASTQKPKGIVLISAHWESDPIQITSSTAPSMYYDYSGFPSSTYEYQYPAPGSPALAEQIHTLLSNKGITSELNSKRGFDHGVFVPMMILNPEADIPVVCVSLHTSLRADTHIALGSALQTLREQEIMIIGSGYTFHNMKAFFSPSSKTFSASTQFNEWLKEAILNSKNHDDMLHKLERWENAPSARECHPREEHLLPLLVTAAAAGKQSVPKLLFNIDSSAGEHAISSYVFE
jgi:4,5-DOPA dioxygenase extradiol